MQEYEAKLEELEAALVHQLKTDTAVEKLEEQKEVREGGGREGETGERDREGKELVSVFT